MSEANKIYLLRGNDTPLSVCLRKREGDGDPVPYDLSAAERIRLALVGHGAHVFASGETVSGEDNNIVSGVIPGRALLKGDYDLEVTFRSGGRDKRFAVEDMFEAVDFLAEDADGETEGEGAGIWVNVTVQPEVIEIAGPTGPRGYTPVLTADEDGTIYADGVLLTEVVKDVTEAVESAERSRVTAESQRVAAESARVSAEQSRVSAETARETQASADHTRAESDHSTAQADHTIAASDHTQAVADHAAVQESLINDVEVTVSNTTGTPVATVDFSDNTLSFAFSNIKGDKGDTDVTKQNIETALGYTPASTTALSQAVTGLGTAIDGKVDKVTGKGLSTNDYTTAEKDKLAGLPSGSELADDLAGKEDVSNKVTTVTSSGTDTQYPSAKAVYDAIEGKKDPTVIAESGAEIVYRQTHGGVATGFSGAAVKGIKGRTLAFNQMIQVTDYPTITDGGITRTNNGDGSITLSGTATGLSYPSHDYYLINGHVYLYRMCPPDGASGKYLAELSGVGADYGNGVIGRMGEATGSRFSRLYIYENAVLNNVVIYPQIIDLTLMFGAGKEPETVEEFEAMFPLPYYGYNEGELISVAAEGIETVGFNLWDEEWGLGYWNTGTGIRTYYPGEYCTENPIPVIAGKTYYVKNAVSNYVIFYDKDMNYLSDASYEKTFTPPAGSAYVQINFGAFSGSYNNDICVNLSDASRNGTYEPHWSKVLPLGLDAFKVKDSQGNIITVNGLAGAGDVRDEIRGGKYIKRVGRVDLGTLNWSYSGNDGVFFTTGINTVVRDASIAANLISSKLEAVGYFDVIVPNKIGAVVDSGDCYVRAAGDTNYNNDATAFKTAMSGVYLYYELATPVEYDLASPMPSLYAVDDLGTEAKYPADTATSVTAPITADIQYGIKSRDIAAEAEDIFTAIRNMQS